MVLIQDLHLGQIGGWNRFPQIEGVPELILNKSPYIMRWGSMLEKIDDDKNILLEKEQGIYRRGRATKSEVIIGF